MKNKQNKPKREKNVVLFLVEGKSDQHALENPINALLDELSPKYRVIFARQDSSSYTFQQINDDEDDDEDEYDGDENGEIETFDKSGGDITSKYYVNPDNIELKITRLFFKPLLEKEKIYSKMLLKVIQIVDLDGAYLDDSRVTNYAPIREGTDKLYYNTDDGVIECRNIEQIVERNRRKRENLDYLQSLETIKIESKSIPYSVYYFSSNLDHFLHENPNSGSKIFLADAFSKNYVINPDGFAEYFINDPCSSKEMSYKESWNRVKNGTCSIERHTNFNLLLEEIRNREFPIPE